MFNMDSEDSESQFVPRRKRPRYSEKDKVIEDLLSSRNSSMHNDVTIKTTRDNQELSANKFMLSARSKYFEAMFSGEHFRESSGEVELPCTKEVMEKVLHFLYSGEVIHDGMSGIQMLEYLDILRLLMLMEPFYHVEGIVTDMVAIGDFSLGKLIPILEKAVDLQLENTAECIFRFIASNYHNAIGDAREELQSMRVETFMHQVLTKVRKPWNNMERLKFYIMWMDANADKLSSGQRQEIKESFNLEEFDVEDLLGQVYKCGLFETEEIFGPVRCKHAEVETSLNETLNEKKKIEGENKLLVKEKTSLRKLGSDLKAQIKQKDTEIKKMNDSLERIGFVFDGRIVRRQVNLN